MPKILSYDHDNLGEVFREIANTIQRILESIQFKGYLQKNFVWKGGVMVAELTPVWFDPRTEWFIGIDRGETEVSDDECRRLVSRENNFLWKVGSLDRDVDVLKAVALEIKPEERPSSTLPPRQYWTFWRVPKDESDANFVAISRSHEIAVYMKDNKNLSFQSSAFEGTSRFPVAVSEANDDTLELRLAIFGLRR